VLVWRDRAQSIIHDDEESASASLKDSGKAPLLVKSALTDAALPRTQR
jgi:hypothetical protein